MAPASLRAPIAAALLWLQKGAAEDTLAASSPRFVAGGAGGVRVLDGVVDEGALAELLSQVPDGITAAAKAGAPLEQQRFALRVPDSLAKSVAGALGRRGEALSAVASEMPASADGQNVSAHQDRRTSGRHGLEGGDVAVLYLHGQGELEFTGLGAAGDGCAASRVVEVAPGRLVLWNNGAVKHSVASVRGAPRIFIGPMALDAGGTWSQVGDYDYDDDDDCRDILDEESTWCQDGYCPDKNQADENTSSDDTNDCCKPCMCVDVLQGDPEYMYPKYVTSCRDGEIPNPAKLAAPAPTREPSADGCCMPPGPIESMPPDVDAALAAAPGASGLWSAWRARARGPIGVRAAGAAAVALAASSAALAAFAALACRRHRGGGRGDDGDEGALLANGLATGVAE